MKHIVFVVGNYKNGGVPMRSTNLANEFAKKGYRATILVTKEISEDIFFRLEKNVELVSLNEYFAEHSDNKKIRTFLFRRMLLIKLLKFFRLFTKHFTSADKKAAAKIKGLRKSEKLSAFAFNNQGCIYIPFGIDYFELVYHALKGTKNKLLYAERNAPELEFPADEKEKELLFKALSKADGAVLQTKDELSFFNGCLRNAAVINNPVKANLPEPFKGERRKVVVNFCRIAEQKNLPLMINAFMEFHKSHPDYSLEIYGNTVGKAEENLRDRLCGTISSLGAEGYIKIFPPRADVHEVIRDCTMFVSSSYFEGLSNSMLEAMAIGLPCVCTDCLGGGAREMIRNGENGLLVPLDDAHALAQAMKTMADDALLSEKCSENAAKVRETHKAETIAAKWLEITERII